MREHLPVLPILLPLVAAPVCVVLRERRVTFTLATIVSWATFAFTVALMNLTLREGTQVYDLGGWPAPLGIEYRIDLLNGFVMLFVSAIGAIVLTFSPTSLAKEVLDDRRYLFYAAYLLCLAGLLGIAITGDLFNVFVFLEISSLSSYAMISLGARRRALTAALQYLVLGSIGATFILIGIGLLYMMTGTLNMADMAARLPEVTGQRTILVAFGFFTVGLAIKMALFPLHLWLPDAYTHAPSVVTAFLAATATKVSVYVMLRVVFTVFGAQLAYDTLQTNRLLFPLALVGIFVASLAAIFQTNIKRMLAYSSVAQIGYMVLAVSLATATGLTAGIVHLFNHALIKGGMFMAVACIMLRLGTGELHAIRGLGRRMPITMLLWVIGGLGLIGVPVTAGFVTKWYLISAALEKGMWPVAALLLVSSLLAVIYVWRVVEVAYFEEPAEDAPEIREAPLTMLVPTAIVIGATLYFGLSTSFSVDIAQRAAAALLGGAQ